MSLEKVFSLFNVCSARFSDFNVRTLNVLQITVFCEKIIEATLIKYFIKVTAR